MLWRTQNFCWNDEAVIDVFCKNIFVTDLHGSKYLFEILQTSLTVKTSENVVKSGCFEKLLRWRVTTLFRNEAKMKCPCVKYWYFAKLLGISFLFGLLRTSSNAKTSKHEVKKGCFSKILWWREQSFFKWKRSVSCLVYKYFVSSIRKSAFT